MLFVALNLNEPNTNWSDSAQTFHLHMKAALINEFTEPILSGIVISVGGLTESVSKSSSASLPLPSLLPPVSSLPPRRRRQPLCRRCSCCTAAAALPAATSLPPNHAAAALLPPLMPLPPSWPPPPHCSWDNYFLCVFSFFADHKKFKCASDCSVMVVQIFEGVGYGIETGSYKS